jgi:2TM domain
LWPTRSKASITRAQPYGSWRGFAVCLGLALSLFLPAALHSEGADPAAARVSTLYDALLAGLAAINLTKNPSHPWFLWVLIAWGIALAVHDVILLIKFPSPSNPNASAAPQNKPNVMGIERA